MINLDRQLGAVLSALAALSDAMQTEGVVAASSPEVPEDKPWEARFAAQVRRRRLERSWSMHRLAKLLGQAGYSDSTNLVLRIEEGTRPVRLNEAYVLAAIFDTTLEEMVAER